MNIQHLLQALLTAFAPVFFVAFAVIAVLIFLLGWAMLPLLWEGLREKMQPYCPACRKCRLTHYRLGFSDGWTMRYYGCGKCKAHVKRSLFGTWETLPPGAANEDEIRALFWRPSSLMQPATEILAGDPSGSWFGSVRVAAPEEKWPEYEGKPMLPLCQLRCSEIPTLPPALSEFALICVFAAFVGEEALSPEGERWLVRTYTSLEDVVPAIYPGDASSIRAYPIAWEVLQKDTPPSLSSVPEEHWIDFIASGLNLRRPTEHSKVGGYRTARDPRLMPPNKLTAQMLKDMQVTVQMQSEFVFQIVINGDFPWLNGAGGILYFSYAEQGNTRIWTLNWDPPMRDAMFDTRRGTDIRLGCEIEGMQLYFLEEDGRDSSSRMGMSYRDRSGEVNHLEDLRGLVHITTAEMALLFVRLRTSGLLLTPEIEDHEMITKAEFDAQPDWCKVWSWGPSGRAYFLFDYLEAIIRATVVYPQDLLASGLEPAHVEPTEGGFRVVRWTYTSPAPRRNDDTSTTIDRGFFRKIAETVASNGAYTCTVLEQRSAIEGEGLSWG
jgi:hypothetical protein